MIFNQSLRRELSFTTGGVFLVLITIMITTLVIRILGFAANGTVNPQDAFVLIALATLGYTAVLLTVSLFVAVLIVLVRWYKDSEMIVWFASGLSVTNLIRPILQFATPLIIVIALLALFVWPWSNRESTLISQRFQQRDDVSMVTAVQTELAKVGITKSRTNQQGASYKFRGIDDVFNTVSPLMAEHGLCILPRVLTRECVERQTKAGGAIFYVTVEVEFDFVSAEDGSKHTVKTFGEAMDTSDKATNKAIAVKLYRSLLLVFSLISTLIRLPLSM